MKTAGIRELKANLSAYVREVERGEVVLVTDRGRVVAELRAPGTAERALSATELRHRELVERGRLRPASQPREWSSWPEPCLPRGAASELLDAERAE